MDYDLAGMKVLTVEDMPDNAELIHKILKRLGLKIAVSSIGLDDLISEEDQKTLISILSGREAESLMIRGIKNRLISKNDSSEIMCSYFYPDLSALLHSRCDGA